jgi:hypothetical protein
MPLAAWLSLIVSLSLATTACVASSYVAPKPEKASIGGGGSEVRQDCAAVYGTAFRSAEERQWFEQNCSKWPPTRFGEMVINRGSGAPLPAQCDAMRGKPYESNEQRRWYLENCNGAPTAAVPSPGSSAGGTNRANCDAIRGSAYRSDAEQTWFLGNCLGDQSQPARPQAPRDRFDCDAIRGTFYNSDGERAWYFQNCNRQGESPR